MAMVARETAVSGLVVWLRAQLDYARLLGEALQALGAPRSPLPAETAALLRGAGDLLVAEVEAKRRLLGEIFRYEAKIDGEWGCCHSPEVIEAGGCEEIDPDEIDGVRLLALPYADRPGFREEWRP